MNNSTFVHKYDSDGCVNITVDLEGVQSLLYTDLQVVILRFVLPVVLVIGVCNNVAFIYVVAHAQSMHTITNKCLVHLSIADLLFLVVGAGERFWVYAYSPITPNDTPYGGSIGCSLFKFARCTSYFSSLAFITLVSIERFNAVCHYHRKRDANTYRNIIICCWLGCSTLSLTFIPSVTRTSCFNVVFRSDEAQFQDFKEGIRWTLCMPEEYWWTIYTEAMQAIPFAVLMIVNVGLYVGIIKGLNAAVKRADLTGKKLRNTEIRNQIAWMLIANGIIFFVLLFPREINFLVGAVISSDAATSDCYQNVNEIASVLAYINSGINPIVYSILSSKHRKAFQDAFLPEKCSQRPEKNANCTGGYLKPIVGQPDDTSMGYRHSPRLCARTEKTEITETV